MTLKRAIRNISSILKGSTHTTRRFKAKVVGRDLFHRVITSGINAVWLARNKEEAKRFKRSSKRYPGGLGLNTHRKRRTHLSQMRDIISDLLTNADIEHVAVSRVKRFSSVKEKIERRGEQDIQLEATGARFYLNTVDDCYQSFAEIKKWAEKKNENLPAGEHYKLKTNDYIKEPRGKYKALHVFVFKENYPSNAVEVHLITWKDVKILYGRFKERSAKAASEGGLKEKVFHALAPTIYGSYQRKREERERKQKQ